MVSARGQTTGTAPDAVALAGRIRQALAQYAIFEQRMFGGTGFLWRGNLLVALSGRGLLVRVGPQAYAQAVASPGARIMSMRGKTMHGYVYVDPAVLEGDGLQRWLDLSLGFVATLPEKERGG